MASPNLNEIVTTTLRNRSGKTADNMLNNNALLSRMKKKGSIKPVSGGRTIVQELEYAQNGTYQRYAGYQVLNIQPSDVFTAAEYDWKQAAVAVTWNGLEIDVQNTGAEQVIDLLEGRIQNAEKTIQNNLSYDLYSNGTADGGLQVGGLQLLVADAPTSGVVGGIDRSLWPFWRNVSYSGLANGGAAVSATTIQGYMNQLWLLTKRQNDVTDFIIADNNYFGFYMGDTLFRLVDRKGADYLLGPTHEELFTLLVKGEYGSYKDLPATLFQIQNKYRDEARPRAGVLRGREFIMKDSYSFDLDDEGLVASYHAHRDAYERMFTRLGLEYRIVHAVSGAMGGSASEEFLAPTEVGEDTFVRCTNCDYAANTEAVEIATPPPDTREHPTSVVLDTPDTPTIATLVARMNELFPDRSFTAADTLKNLVVKTRAPGAEQWELLVIGVPGDRDVDLHRVAGQLEPVEVEAAAAEDLARQPGLVRGYIGPQVLADLGVRYLVDPLVVEGSAWITGANSAGHHATDVVRGRDFVADGEIGAVEIRDGDHCPLCGAVLVIARGIELGHVFQLGRKYADVFGLDVIGADGKPIRVTMGSYGVGVSRAVAALAEQTLDGQGLRWPRSVSPADIHLVIAGKDKEIAAAAELLASQLEAAGLRVMLDDRAGLSPGVKFRDAELIGITVIVTVGRGLASGQIEVRDRWSDERRDIPLAGAVEELARVVASVR